MGEKIERGFAPEELADYLEKLAQQLRHGSFEVDGTHRGVPSLLDTKIEVREKKGCINAKLRFRWSVLNEYDEKTRAKMTRQQREYREVKNQLAEVFSELLELANLWVLPAESKVMRFVELSQEFSTFTDPDWENELEEFLNHVNNLCAAVQDRNLDGFERELRDLKVLVRACHRENR